MENFFTISKEKALPILSMPDMQELSLNKQGQKEGGKCKQLEK